MSPSSQPVHVNSATGIVGPTGSGKSSLIATAAEYLADTYPGQVLLLYTADGGGFPTKVQSLVKLGIIRVWRMRTRGEAFETCVRASSGWWPSRIVPSTGETKPNVPLVPPITERYTMRCPNGHVVKVVRFQNLLTPAVCKGCQLHVTKDTMQVERESHRTKGFEAVGAVAYDGMTSFLNWMMNDMARRTATLELRGEETALGGRIVSGEIALGGNNRAHYGFVQGRAEEMVGNSLGIPHLRLPPIWTGLMLETVDEGNLSIRGMKLAGKAKTDEAAAWFGNMLEIAVVKDEDGHDVRRLWLSEYIDEAGARHLVKHRGSPNMPPYLQDPHGQPWSQVHLGVFFDLLSKDIETNLAAAEAKYSEAPGMPEGEVSYGEEVEKPTAAPPASPGVVRPAPARGPVGRRPAPKAATPARTPVAPTVPVETGPQAESPASPETPSAEAETVSSDGASAPEPATPEPTLTSDDMHAPDVVETRHEVATPAALVRPAPRPAPRPAAAVAPRAANATKPYAPPPAPRPPASAPRVPGLLPRKQP